jgi:hypothetical protein
MKHSECSLYSLNKIIMDKTEIVVSKKNTPIIRGFAFSTCCKAQTTLINTLNDIKCYKCISCERITGIEDEHGNRLN